MKPRTGKMVVPGWERGPDSEIKPVSVMAQNTTRDEEKTPTDVTGRVKKREVASTKGQRVPMWDSWGGN